MLKTPHVRETYSGTKCCLCKKNADYELFYYDIITKVRQPTYRVKKSLT